MRKILRLSIFFVVSLLFFCPYDISQIFYSNSVFNTQLSLETSLLKASNSKEDENLEDSLLNSVVTQIENLNLEEMEKLIDGLTDEQKELFSNSSFKEKLNTIISGKYEKDFGSEFLNIINLLFDGILNILPFIATIIGVAVISSLVTKLAPSSNKKTIKNIIYFVCFGVVLLLVSNVFIDLLNLSKTTLNNISNQMNAVFPLLLTLMSAVGSAVSVASYQPLLAILSSGIVNIFIVVILPLFVISIVFDIVGNLSSNIKLTKFSSMIKNSYKWIISIVFLIFSSILILKGITATTYDGISIRTAKFALKSYIPIVGGYLADGMNMVLASSVLLKNGIGVVGLSLLFSSIIIPIVKILSFKFALSFASSVVEPITDSKLSTFLDNSSKNLMILIVSILVVSFMYFISTGLIMISANIF